MDPGPLANAIGVTKHDTNARIGPAGGVGIFHDSLAPCRPVDGAIACLGRSKFRIWIHVEG